MFKKTPYCFERVSDRQSPMQRFILEHRTEIIVIAVSLYQSSYTSPSHISCATLKNWEWPGDEAICVCSMHVRTHLFYWVKLRRFGELITISHGLGKAKMSSAGERDVQWILHDFLWVIECTHVHPLMDMDKTASMCNYSI